MVESWRERITADPAVPVGKPVVRGTRLSVEFVLGLVAAGWAFDEILANYPGLLRDDILACVAYAREAMVDEKLYPAAGA